MTPSQPHATARSRRLLTVLAVALACLLAAIGIPDTNGTLSGSVNNTTNTASSSIYASVGTGSCTTAARTASANFVYPFSELAGPVAADVSNNNRPGTYTLGGVTYGVRGPCPRDNRPAVTLDGSTGYVSGPVAAMVNPTNFSIQVWFRTATAGGKLIGFGNTRTGASTQIDRHIYMSDDGRLHFGIRSGTPQIISSTDSYNDDQWHHAVATSANNNNPTTGGIRLYVDGALVADNRTLSAADPLTGFWRIGYDSLTGWPNAPTNPYFTGSVSYAAYFMATLNPAQVSTLNTAGI